MPKITKMYPYLEPMAAKCIRTARRNKADIITSIKGFQTREEAMILKDFLQYACDSGVAIIFAPKLPEKKVNK